MQMRKTIVLLTVLAGFWCQAQSDYAVSAIPEDMLANANSVIREEKVTIEIPDIKTQVYKSRQVVTVLNKNGNRDVDAYVYYDKSTRVRKAEAIIYDKNGKELKKIKKRDFRDASAVEGGTLFSDSRILYMRYTPTEYPYTVVFDQEWVTDNTAGIPSWFPNGGYYSATRSSECVIRYAPELNLKYKVINERGIIDIQEGSGSLRISTSGYAAIEPEDHGPPISEFVPHVIFALDKFSLEGVEGNSESWGSFGNWMNQSLLKGVSDLPEETKQEIRSLVAGETDLREKAKKVYNYVQDRTRYISVQIGIGGWRPMKASEVDNLGYGDCKALTNYTKALMEVAEIPSYYTVLYAGRRKRDMIPDFSSMQGNHTILAVPEGDDYIWLECTSQDVPFGYIANFTDDRDVLVVTPEGGKIAHTKVYDSEESILTTTGSYQIDAAGNIEAEVKMVSGGIQYGHRYDIETEDKKDREERYKNYWDYVNNVTINSMSFENDKDKIEFVEDVSFSARSYATFAGGDMIVPVNALNRSDYIPKRYKNRSQPVKISRGFLDIDEVVIRLPEGYTLGSVPEPIEYETKFGRYESSIEIKSEKELLYKRRLNFEDGLYPKEEYKDYRSFRRKISKHDNQKIVLTKKT